MNELTSNFDVSRYRTLIFDCDGVILNSNPIKTEAFYRAALPYGEEAARALREYHVRNGGISRYHKFEWFLTHVIGQREPDREQCETLLATYARSVWQGMLSCDIDDAIFKLRERLPQAQWMVASGGNQEELREIFHVRGLDSLFDGKIFGSPRTKNEIFAEIEKANHGFRPALFMGDSRYDAQAAKLARIDFVFVSHWSDVEPTNSEMFVESLGDIVNHIADP